MKDYGQGRYGQNPLMTVVPYGMPSSESSPDLQTSIVTGQGSVVNLMGSLMSDPVVQGSGYLALTKNGGGIRNSKSDATTVGYKIYNTKTGIS